MDIRKTTRQSSVPLGRLILLISAAFVIFSVSVVTFISIYMRDRAIDDLASQDAKKTSKLVFESLYAAMRKGWTKDDIRDIIDRLNLVEPDMRIRVFRGDPVIRQFGELPGEKELRESDPKLAKALTHAEEFLISGDDSIRYIYPIVVKQECLACHTLAKEGEVNGVIDISYPVHDLKLSIGFIINIIIVTFGALMALLFTGLYMNLKVFVVAPVMHFVSVIQEIIQHTDLTKRILRTSRISELQHMSEYFNRLLSTLQSYQSQLEDLSIRDPLTSAFNRRKFDMFLEDEIERSMRHNHHFSLIMLDLDNFKHINDTYGHPVGDLALREVSLVIQKHKRKTDILARLGGDEFAIILPETPLEDGISLAEKIRNLLASTLIELPSGSTKIRASVGVVAFPVNGENAESMKISMDVAMYKAKKQGKNKVCVIDQGDQQIMMDVFTQGEFLRKALDEDRLEAFFQPIMDTQTGDVFAYEVLARIRENDRVIPAVEFIHTAEELGYAEELDRRILEKGIRCMRNLNQQNKRIKMFFNFSSRTFSNTETIRRLPLLVREMGGNPKDMVLEITEREALPQIHELAPVIDELRTKGIEIALDDFGSGFSSFMYLKYLNVDYVKIEGSFIKNMSDDKRDLIMVKNINQMAHEFGLRTIAEFVEDPEVHRILKEMNINYSQGYLYGKPGPCGNNVEGFRPG